MSTTMTRQDIKSVLNALCLLGYEEARVSYVRLRDEHKIPVLNLLEAGFSVAQVYTLLTIADRLRRYHTERCNRPLHDEDIKWADRDEGIARQIILYAAPSPSPAPLTPRTTVIDAEITGLPGGASFRVRLKSERTGEELRGNDFGDSRYTAF